MPRYAMVIPVEEFDAEVLPPNAREAGSPEFAFAAQRYLEDALSTIGGQAEVQVDEDFIRVLWETECDFRDLGKASVRKMEAGAVQEALQLLRLWVTGYAKDDVVRYSIALPLIGFGLDYQRKGELDNAADCWFDAARHIASALETERADLQFRKECAEALLRCCRLLHTQMRWAEAANALESLVENNPDCQEAWAMLAEAANLLGDVQEASLAMSELAEPAQSAP